MRKRIRKASQSEMKCAMITASAFMPKADRMVQRLCEQHAVGSAAIAAEKTDGKSTAAYAAEVGVNQHTLRKLKAFARLYYARGEKRARGQSSLDTLCCFRRKDSRLGLHWGHLLVLLGVSKASDRFRWAKHAADNNWSPQRLRAELRKGKPVGHGRPLKRHESPLDGIAQVLAEGTRWIARCELVVSTCEKSPKECRDAATRKVAGALHQFLETVGREVPKCAARLKAVGTKSQSKSSKTKPQLRPATSR